MLNICDSFITWGGHIIEQMKKTLGCLLLVCGLLLINVGCLRSNGEGAGQAPQVLKYKNKLYGATWGALTEKDIPYLKKIGEVNNIEVFKDKRDSGRAPAGIYPLIDNVYVIYKREDLYTKETGMSFEELYGYKEGKRVPEVK